MRRLALVFLVLLAGVFVFAGCGGGDDERRRRREDSVELTQSKDLTIAMVTHGDGGSFWAVAKKGAEAGGQGHGRRAQVLGVQQRPRGAGAADRGRGHRGRRRPRGLRSRTRTRSATRSRPRSTPASRSSRSTRAPRSPPTLGAITHVGQTETIAGEGAGEKLKEAGATKLICVIHEQGNVGLNQRCEGAKKGFGGDGREPPGGRHDRRLDDADRDPVEARVRHVDRRRAGAQPGHRGRRARRGRGRELGGQGRHVRPLRRRHRRRSRTARSCSRSTSSSTSRATCRSSS